ncbi:CspA family cold shock protein [Nocardia tenerifensis]|uniref:CspA family cold shock protein n=1 Tax=Nocardia tenerifensis TaxID=228006 RepID=A0A318K014_9NOCA|nr:cold shock domain-containing protein [Nocardia tenerifensis]PXX61607.1 CspA family cold shock protein [Nocardia tenerifensis]
MSDGQTWVRGTVQWFDTAKGFGFLSAADYPNGVFVEYSSIDSPGFKTLSPGQEVVFTCEHRPRGVEAVEVRQPALLSTAAA